MEDITFKEAWMNKLTYKKQNIVVWLVIRQPRKLQDMNR